MIAPYMAPNPFTVVGDIDAPNTQKEHFLKCSFLFASPMKSLVLFEYSLLHDEGPSWAQNSGEQLYLSGENYQPPNLFVFFSFRLKAGSFQCIVSGMARWLASGTRIRHLYTPSPNAYPHVCMYDITFLFIVTHQINVNSISIRQINVHSQC